MDDPGNRLDVEQRLQLIEKRLDLADGRLKAGPPVLHPAWPFLMAAAAIVFGYFGLGLPQHYYHVLFSGLLLLLLYHRGSLRMAAGPWRWPQVFLNVLLLCLLFKFLIGGGITHPFDWIKMPAIIKTPPPADPSWYSTFVPEYSVQWQAIPKFAEWSLDVTKIQTILLLAIFAGALFRFEPFTSIIAFALLIISLPTYLQYNWDWVVLFLIIGSISLYVQSPRSLQRR